MGRVQFYDRIIFGLITGTAFFVSGIVSTGTYDVLASNPLKLTIELMELAFIGTDQYSSVKFHYTKHYPASFFWVNMESGEQAVKLTDDQFTNGSSLIYLPFDFQLFDHIVTRVAVTKEGIIQSADPSVNWTIAPINAKSGMSRCDISYMFNGYGLYIQWNNFRFKYKNFEDDFSFQVRLGDKGEIDFVYRRVPYNMTFLRQTCRCLGESFGVTFSRQEVYNVLPYYETFELGFSADFRQFTVKDGTVVRFLMADTCMFQKSCEDCMKTEYHVTRNETAPCWWCPKFNKCSNKRDIFKHLWNMGMCDRKHFDYWDYCTTSLKDGNEYADVWFIFFFGFGCIILAGCSNVAPKRAWKGPGDTGLKNQINQAGNQNSDAGDEEDEEYEDITFEWEDYRTRIENTYV